jgi:hypothetical protein
MSSNHPSSNQSLIGFSQAVLGQALGVVQAHVQAHAQVNAQMNVPATLAQQRRPPAYAQVVGPHVRHVIEHVEALFAGPRTGVLDYDSRARDRALESDPHLAQQRLLALQQRLGQLSAAQLDAPVQVLGQAGLEGEFNFRVASSVGRELAFLASHAVHHFALLAAHCREHRIPTPAHFGQAPSTVAHQLAHHRAPTSHAAQPAHSEMS